MKKNKLGTKIVNYTNYYPYKFRHLIYKWVGLIGNEDSVDIRKGVCFDDIYSVEIGNHVMINQNVRFYTGESKPNVKIKISNNVFIGMDTKFVCVSHLHGDEQKRAGMNVYSSIEVGTGTWIGANVLILPGVHIGEGCIIAAGSVVISDCEENWLYAGNPAKKKKRLS